MEFFIKLLMFLYNKKMKGMKKMIIDGKEIENKSEIVKLIKNGVNVLEFIKVDSDIDLISTSIVLEGKDDDLFYEESAEMILKAAIYYVLNVDGEEKSLTRCKEILQQGINNEDGVSILKNIFDKEYHAKDLYKFMDIALERNQKLIMEKLKERLTKI